jgi:hypothetical protein
MSALSRAGFVAGLLLAAAARLAGQSPLFVLDVQGTALDEFPSGVKALIGTMTTVDKNGQRMLRASSPSEFLITLPQNLPAAFTVIVDLIPKACCNPDDFMLEGTPTMNRGVGSTQLTWQPSHIMAVGGGGEMYQSDMPADLAASTPSNLTQLVWEFKGTTIKLYTNGRRMYTLDKQFARGRVLRVWLGGADEGLNAAYLAGLSVLDGAVAAGVIAGAGPPGGVGVTAGQLTSLNQQSNPRPTVNPSQQQTATQQSASTGGALPTVVSSVSVAQGAAGPVVNWLPVSVPAAYSVRRWKIDDLTCCNNASPPSPALTGPPWQDAPLPVAGTYVYEVTATMSGGVASGQAQFVKLGSGGQIATVAPSTAPVTAVLVGPTTATATPISPSSAPVLPAPSSLPTLAPPPPPPPPVSAPIAPAPTPGGTSTLVLGPATLTASLLGWGIELHWPEVVGGVDYQVEGSTTGQTFAAFGTIGTQYQQAGMFSFAVQGMQPGSTTFFRVRAVLGDGTVTPYSPVVRHDAPIQPPYVSKLATLFVGQLGSNASVGYKGVRWGWAEITGVDDATQYAIQTDVFARDATGALIPVPGGSKRSGSSTNMYEDEFKVTSGNSVRFCISVVLPPKTTDPLQYAVCQMTAIP